MSPFGRRDEAPHEPGPSQWWEECWELEFVAPDGALGGFVRLARYPNQRRAWCWVYVLRGDGTVVVRDHDVPLTAHDALLARAEGLWCELVCETPMEHWSIGVEAFGVRLDDPSDGLRGEIGTRLPVGLELDWESTTPTAADELRGYQHAGHMTGDVLLGDEVIPFDGVSVFRHVWGARDWNEPSVSMWCAWSDGEWSVHDAPAPFTVRPQLDAVIPLPDAMVLTRSVVAVADPSGRTGTGMRSVVRIGSD